MYPHVICFVENHMSGRPLCLVLVFPNDLNAIPKERGEPHIITASLPFEVKISHVKKINYRELAGHAPLTTPW